MKSSPRESDVPKLSVVPPLSPDFIPPILVLKALASGTGRSSGVTVKLAVERENGFIYARDFVFPSELAQDATVGDLMERAVKFLLWAGGGWRIHYYGPAALGERLAAEYSKTGARKFDVDFMSDVYERPFEFVTVKDPAAFPGNSENERRIGGHVDGCRIGFDLGASDFKIAAVRDGKPVFTEEIPWTPGVQSDPEYHYRALTAGLRKAASFLPRVEAIGGSSAGVLINNQVRVASLFRSVPAHMFDEKVKPLFKRMADEWGVPFEVINDGEVTAMAGMVFLGEPAVLGVAMGSSQAAGYVNGRGLIPGRLDELAFVPVDMDPDGPSDEWSGDRGVGANYFSQQAVGRLAADAGIELPAAMPLPMRLKEVQKLADSGDVRALKVFETIGVYLGYTIPWYEVFYDFRHMLVLGRVMSGSGGETIMNKAHEVLDREFPRTAARVELHLLDERSRLVGQAVAAAGLPEIGPQA